MLRRNTIRWFVSYVKHSKIALNQLQNSVGFSIKVYCVRTRRLNDIMSDSLEARRNRIKQQAPDGGWAYFIMFGMVLLLVNIRI